MTYETASSDLGWAIVCLGNRNKLFEIQIMEVFPEKDYDVHFLSS